MKNMTTIHRFTVIDEAVVFTLCRGVLRQVKLYRRGEILYAPHGGGFIRLFRGGGTTVPHVSWRDIDAPGADVIEDAKTLDMRITLPMGVAAE